MHAVEGRASHTTGEMCVSDWTNHMSRPSFTRHSQMIIETAALAQSHLCMTRTHTPHSFVRKPQFDFLSREDVEKLYHRFLHLDRDSSGTIELDEFLALPGVRENPLATRILETFDENGDGLVDFAEFVNGLAVFSSRGDRAARIKFAFDVYDIDRDGYISNGELFLTLKVMSGDHLEDAHLQVVDKTIRDADRDGDGRISLEEFTQLVETRNSTILDRWRLTDL